MHDVFAQRRRLLHHQDARLPPPPSLLCLLPYLRHLRHSPKLSTPRRHKRFLRYLLAPSLFFAPFSPLDHPYQQSPPRRPRSSRPPESPLCTHTRAFDYPRDRTPAEILPLFLLLPLGLSNRSCHAYLFSLFSSHRLSFVPVESLLPPLPPSLLPVATLLSRTAPDHHRMACSFFPAST